METFKGSYYKCIGTTTTTTTTTTTNTTTTTTTTAGTNCDNEYNERRTCK